MLVVFPSPVLSSLFLGAESLTLTEPTEAFIPAALQFYLGIMAPSPGRWSLNVLDFVPHLFLKCVCGMTVAACTLSDSCYLTVFFSTVSPPNTKRIVRWVPGAQTFSYLLHE